MTTTPYDKLSPVLILDAIESLGYQCSGSLFALNSYENRVYQIGIENDAPIIAKFYRPLRWSDDAILEEHAFSIELASHEIGVIPPLAQPTGKTLHKYEGYRYAIFARQQGRPLELEDAEQLEWVGRFLGRLHALGATKPFTHRLSLTTKTYGEQPYRFLIENDFIPPELKQSYTTLLETLLIKIEECFQEVEDVRYIRVHGDCHASNILWSGAGPHIVDLDDCLMAPAIQDIWMLLPGGSAHETERQLNHILRGYCDFNDFNWREVSLISALRTLRMIHYSGWLAKRWEDPAFPINFPWFNTLSYWKEQITHLSEQLHLLNEGKGDWK
ncbi:MAG TPA: serine/threonine protein kinase [Gammaproteobacteria bacterium]|nr:serine/threonine protein kinase [Gammaproteobacteria bacterium]